MTDKEKQESEQPTEKSEEQKKGSTPQTRGEESGKMGRRSRGRPRKNPPQSEQ